MAKDADSKILFLWKVNEQLKDYLHNQLEQVPNIKLVFPIDTSEQNLVKLAREANVIVGWRPTKKLLLAARKLQLFINPGAGVQHLIELFRDISKSREVLLTNCHGNSYFVAQHVVALLLSLTNHIIQHHNWMMQGAWRKGDGDAKSIPLRGRKLGLLGYGAVNRKVHRFLSGFDVEFSILRRKWTTYAENLPTPAKKYGPSDLHDFLERVDTLLIAAPLTPLTRGMIAMRELNLLGPEGLIVNVGRGAIIDEYSLYIALREKLIKGAAIDVWYNYDPQPDDEGKEYSFSQPFNELPNIILSPHRAASPLDDLQRWDEVVKNIRAFSSGGKYQNIVDLEEAY